jgi:hypothetical protein
MTWRNEWPVIDLLPALLFISGRRPTGAWLQRLQSYLTRANAKAAGRNLEKLKEPRGHLNAAWFMLEREERPAGKNL